MQEAETSEAADANGADIPLTARNLKGQILGPKGIRTRTSIVEATRALICEKTFRELSAVDIAQHAGVSIASLYTYFEDVSAIVVALVEDISSRTPDMHHFLSTPWNSPEAIDDICMMIGAIIDYNLAHYPLLRLRNHLADEGDERLAGIRSRAAIPIVDGLSLQILTNGNPGNDLARYDAAAQEDARLTAGLLMGMIDRLTVLVVQHPYGQRTTTKEQYISTAARIIHAAVKAPLPKNG